MSLRRCLWVIGCGLCTSGCGSRTTNADNPYDTTDYVSGNDPIDDAADASGGGDTEPQLGPALPVAYEGDAPPAADTSPDAAPESGLDGGAPIDGGGLTCTDTTFDMNGDPTDGCEVTDPVTNHSEAAPSKLSVLGACGSYKTVAVALLGDARTHTPSGAFGAAPLYWSFFEDASCALGERPTLGSFAVAGGAPGTYEVVIYPQGGAPDPKCTAAAKAGETIGPIVCANPISSRAFLRIRKLDGAPGTADITFKLR